MGSLGSWALALAVVLVVVAGLVLFKEILGGEEDACTARTASNCEEVEFGTDDASSSAGGQALLFVEDLFQHPVTACDRMTPRFLIDNYGNSGDAAKELCRSDVAESLPAPTLEDASLLSVAKNEAVVRAEDSDGNGAILHVVRRNQTWMLDRIRDN